MGTRLAQTVRRSLIHPVVLPILLGLAYHATGLGLPRVVDDVLATLGLAVVPLSLVTIGLNLHLYGLRGSGRSSLALAAGKLLLHPLLVFTAAWVFGLHGLPLVVAVVCASLPAGANVLLFALRYDTANRYDTLPGETTAAIVVSTLCFPLTATLVLFVIT
jgi:malonate transporter and related proteins